MSTTLSLLVNRALYCSFLSKMLNAPPGTIIMQWIISFDIDNRYFLALSSALSMET